MIWIGDGRTEDMAGVTLGLGAYRGRAEIAARQFAWATGLPAAVVEDRDLDRVRNLISTHGPADLAAREIPFVTKLFVLDLVDRDRVVYFDADLLYVNRWDPLKLDPDCLHVVRDRDWFGSVQADCHVWDIPADRYFNTGLLVLNRRLHLPVLREAARCWSSRTDSPFHDQGRINAAACHLGARIHWLHRDHNALGDDRTCEVGRFAVKGIHLGGGYPESAYSTLLAAHQGRGIECFVPREGAVGTWTYERRSETREMELREDGTVGRGSADCERYWRVWLAGGVPTLGVFGCSGGEDTITETFHAVRDGDVWRGRWNRFEQDACRLRPGEGISGGLSRFSFDENGTVPFERAR